MHIPSFLVGTFTTGGIFLIVHQQTSFRSRLTYKWQLAETTETTVRQWIASVRSGAGGGSSSSSSLVETTATPSPPSPKQYWNQGISKLQDVINQSSK